ncbi:MAG: SH3 domain-containing protein [Lachnospiraceae bacterium]|nr:SH3 domain-containing protein [Lachnospiraceae bacterium]
MGISTEDLKSKGKALKGKAVKLGKTIKWSVLDIVDVAMKNKKVTLPILGLVLVAIVTTIVLISKPGEAIEASGTPLEENAYPEINALVAEYMTAKANGDMDTIYSLRNYVDNEEKLRIEAYSKYIESYDNLICYTKSLPTEDTYLVFIYSEAKMYDIETKAPAIQSYYACKNEEGKFYFYQGDLDENVNATVNEMMEEEDVLELFNQVSVKYQEAIDADPALKDLMENQIINAVSEDMGEMIAAEVLGVSENDSTVSENELAVSGNEVTVSENEAEPEVIQYAKAITVVNVRSSDSETADKLGKLQTGDTYRLYENRINGWSKIDYNGTEAFVKTDYLEIIAEETETDAEEEQNEETTETTLLDTSDGYVTAKTTVNVRERANQNSDKLGVIYQGEKLELIMQQADGWCKVKYKGKEGYVKTEFVE